MNCDRTRELLLELEPATFDEVEHLRTCVACRAFADQLRAADGGDSTPRGAQAQQTARRPSRAVYATLGIVVVLAATALVWSRTQLQEQPISEPAPVVAPPAPAPPVPTAQPVEEPAAALPVPPSPMPSAPPRPRRPRPAPPPPVEEVVPAPVPEGGSIVVRISPNLPGIYSASLSCGSKGAFASRSGDVLQFDDVPEGPCKMVFRGTDAITTNVSTGTWLLTRANGVTVLVHD